MRMPRRFFMYRLFWRGQSVEGRTAGLVKQVGTEEFEYNRSSWILSALNWSTVMKARARIDGGDEAVPTHVGDIELHSLSRQMFAWWLDARGSRVMPVAEDVQPKSLVELLSYIRLLQWNEDGDLVHRIFGSALVAASGIDLTGHSVFLVDDYPDRANDLARLKMIHDHPCGLLLHRNYVASDGTVCTCEFINLPVSGGNDGANRIIGTIIPCQPIGEDKLKFNVTGAPVLRRAAFIDIGFGLPDAATKLSV